VLRRTGGAGARLVGLVRCLAVLQAPMHRIAIIAFVLAGCHLLRRGYEGPVAPRVPGPLALEVDPAADATPCHASAPSVVGDPRWKPRASGALAVVDVRGEPRLTFDRFAAAAWSHDGTLFATADRDAVALWRSRDGALADLLEYPGGALSVSSVAVSASGRWIAVDGTHGDGGGGAVTIVFDRDRAAVVRVRTLERSLGALAFIGDTAVLHGTTEDLDVARWTVTPWRGVATRGVFVSQRGGAIELVDAATAKVHRLPFDSLSSMAITEGGTRIAVARPGALVIYALPEGTVVRDVPLPGSEHVVISPDGRRVAGWTLARVVLLGERTGARPQPPRPVAPQPKAFLAMWDVASGRELWRDSTRCCERWEFTDDGEWLQPGFGRLGSELVRASSGQVVAFPGRLLPASPRGTLVPLISGDGFELWSTGGVRKIAPPHAGEVVARSVNGATVVHRAAPSPLGRGISIELGHGPEVLVVGERCTITFPHGGSEDLFAFSPDGAELYGAHPARGTTAVGLWSVGDGRLVHAMHSNTQHRVSPMPARGRFAFDVDAGVRIVDARTGREVTAAPAPRVRYSDGPGLVWDVRDPDGERTSTFGLLTATPDGRYLIGSTSLREAVVTIWDLVDPRRTLDLPVPGIVSALAVSADGKRIAAGNRAGRIAVWTRPDPVARPASNANGWVRSLAFSPDGTWLAAGSDDGVVRVTEAGGTLGTLALVADRPQRLTWLDDHTLVIDTARHLVVTTTITQR